MTIFEAQERARLAPIQRALETARASYARLTQSARGVAEFPNFNKLIDARIARGEKPFA